MINIIKKAQDEQHEQSSANYIETTPKTPSIDDPARFTVGDYNKLIELGSTLMGTNYLMVYGTGTPAENGAELQTIYNAAKAKSPSATNVITIVVAPGNYDSCIFDTSYINVISLTGNADVTIHDISPSVGQHSYFKGIVLIDFIMPKNSPNIILENCVLNGAFDSAGDANNPINSTLINCNIQGQFGTDGGNFAARLIGCTIDTISIGSGKFTGLAENCTLTLGTFPTPTGAGKIINCVDSTGNVINSTKVSVADGINAKDAVNKGQLDALNSYSGTNYLMVYGTGTPAENGAELQTVYNAAKAKSPSATNVITIIVAPGNYDFGAKAFVHDTAYIDIVSLTGDADVFLKSSEYNPSLVNNYGIKVTANHTLVKGINCGNNNFYIADSLNYLTCTNCTGGSNSFGSGGGSASGTFTNCTGGNGSFGGDGIASGTFTNCTGGNGSFGGGGTASGSFKDCTGDVGSFGGGTGEASGTFINCISNNYSFGGGGTVSGTFTNCTGGGSSFGGDGGTITTDARLYYCRLTSGTFSTPASGGKIIDCVDSTGNVVNSYATYADESAATTAGLPSGTIYKTPTGELRIKL